MPPPMPPRLVAELVRVAKLPWRDLLFLGIATHELALARLRHREPIDAILRRLQAIPDETSGARQPPPITLTEVRRISWAIAAAAKRVPWRSDCLLQAMAAHRWLRRKGLQAAVFVGVRRDDQGQLIAHAWSHHGELTITGGRHDEFHVMLGPSSFTSCGSTPHKPSVRR
jgi:hypothetical protein